VRSSHRGPRQAPVLRLLGWSVLVLNLSDDKRDAHASQRISLHLTTPSLLSRATHRSCDLVERIAGGNGAEMKHCASGWKEVQTVILSICTDRRAFGSYHHHPAQRDCFGFRRKVFVL
jgi:hypothetical protein